MNFFTIKILKNVFFVLSFLLISITSFAQVPSNDEPCNAIVLTPSASCNYATFTNVDASNSAGPGIPNPTPFITCGAFSDADVWFKVTVPPGATSTVIDTKNLGMTDGGMTVYTATGVCPTLTMTQVICIDDGSANPGMPKLTLTNPPGTVLYVRMYGNGGETGTFGICVTSNVPPVNDECDNAISLTVNPDYNCAVVSTGHTTINATASDNTPNPTCSVTGINDDVWFTFIATNTNHRISLLNVLPVANAMSFQLYSGTCTVLSLVSCNTTGTADFSSLVVGNTYLVRAFTTSSTSTVRTTFDVCVGTLPPPPPNDDCANAFALTINPTLTCTIVKSGTTQSATASTGIPAPSCGVGGQNDDVWYSFVATSTSHRVSMSNIVPAATGMVMVAYSGATCAVLSEIVCSTTTPFQLNGLTIGNDYFIRVFTTSSTAATVANFDICIATPPPPPPNDECIGAIALTVNADFLCGVTTTGTTLSATPSASAPTPTCGVANAFNDDVWFSFIATSARHRITLSAITGYTGTMVIQVLSGTCGALTQVVCNTVNSFDVNSLTPGNTYYVRIFTNTASVITEATSFNLCIGSPPPPPPNDDCVNAGSLIVNPTLTCSGFTQATIISATPSGTLPVPSCAPTGVDDDVWFKFVATNDVHQISLFNILPVTTMAVAVYSGSCTALTEIVCNQTNLFNVYGLTAGNTYYVRVYSSGTTANLEVDFRICLATPPPPPPNDDCLAATALTVNANLTCISFATGTTQSALQSSTLPTPSCAPANSWNDDVWYKFVAAAPVQRITLYGIAGTTDLITTVYSGACNALTEIACSDPEVFNVAGLTVGNTYYVRVFTKSTSLTAVATTFNICVSNLPPPPPNDECTGATPLTINNNLTCATVLAGTTVGATLSNNLPTPSCATANSWNDDVWYKFVATTNSHRITLLNISGLTTSMVSAVYSGTCGALTQVICNTANTYDANNLVVGDTYYVRVLTAASTPEDANFSICIGSPAPNTTCATSIPFCNQISDEVNFPSTQGITVGAAIGCLFTTPNRNWFDIVVVTAGPIFIEISQTGGNVSNDVDFAAWGPFTSPSAACTAIATPVLQAPIVNIPLGVPTAASTQGGCSYSAAAIEYFKIPNALPGQVYKLLVTNFSTSNNNLPPFTTPSQFVKLKSMIPVGSGGASLDCNLTCFSATATNNGPVCPGGTFNLASTGSSTPFSWVGPVGSGFVSSAQNITGLTAPTTPGNYDYTVTVGTGTSACVKTTTLVVTAPPAAPVVSTTPVVYCQGATATALSATAIVGNTLTWYTSATATTGTATLIPSTAAVGTITYYVSQSAGTCAGPRASINVTVIALPALPVVTTPADYCQGETALALTASGAVGNTLLYYTSLTGGVGVTTLTPLTTTAGTTTYYVSQKTSAALGGCEGPRAPIVVTVKPTPAPPTTTNLTYCEGATTSAVIAGGLTAGATLQWYTSLTGATAIATPTPSNTANSTYYVTQILNGCESTPRAALTTTITATPLAPTVAAVGPLYCQGATGVLALTATASAGNTLLWYTSTTAPNGTGTATQIPTTTGTTTYYVSQQTANNCEGPRVPLIVTITPTPALPVVTTPADYCQGETALALTASGAVGNTLLYYTSLTGGVGVTTLTPSTTTAGTTTYYVSQKTSAALGGCEGPRAPIVVTVKPTPAPPTTTNLTYCEGATTSAVIAGGLTAGATLQWYTSLTGATAIATPTPSNTANSTYYVTQLLNGCESSPRVALTTTITPTPVAPTVAASGPLYCQGATGVPALTATVSAGNTLLWYTTATLGTGNATQIPTTTGTTTYYVSQQTANNCEGPRVPLTVTITLTPALPSVTNPADYCQGTTAAALTATPSAGNTLLYYNAVIGGTAFTTLTPSTTTAGTTTYYVSQKTSAALGGCEGPRAPIVVTVKPTPAPPTTTNLTYCEGATTSAVIAGGLTAGATLQWYTSLTGATAIATPTPSNTANSTYYVTQILNGCESTPRAALTTTITATPLAPTVAAVGPLYCQGATGVLALTATASAGNTLLWYTSTTAPNGTGTATQIPTTTGTTTYYVSQQTSNNCEGPRVPLIVTITPTPALPVVTTPSAYCQGTTALALSATASAGNTLLYYYAAIGGTAFTTLTPSTTTAGTTTYYVSQKTSAALGGCEGPRAPIVVTVKLTPAPPIPTILTTPYCQGALTAPLAATVVTGATLKWYTALTGGVAIPTPSPSNVANSTYYVTQTLNGCESTPRVALTTTITPTPVKPIVVPLVKYCPGDPADPLSTAVTALPNYTLVYYNTATGGVGSTIPIVPITTVAGNFNYYVSQVTPTTLGGCESPRALITVAVGNNSLSVNIGKDTTICEGGTATFTPIVTPNATDYSWRILTANIPLSTISDVSTKDVMLTPVDTAEYILRATLGGCFLEDTVKVRVIWKPKITSKGNFAICNNTSTTLAGIISHNSTNDIDYNWSPKDSLLTPDKIQTIAEPKLSTKYTITYQTQATYGCSFTDSTSMKLTIQPKVKAFAGNDTIAATGLQHKLKGLGGINYTWSSNTGISIIDANKQNAFVILDRDATIQLKVKDAIGCEGTDEIFIKVYNGPIYHIPNSFTPNGDGLNDIFRAIPAGISNTTYFRVFNRLGQLVFETNQWLKGWDGKLNGVAQPSGVYVWMVKGVDKDNKKVELQGTVNLIR
jgi:gliding motility-associated-like protein